MANYVCNGANMQCSFGTSPGSLTVLPDKKIMEENQPAANIMDFKPMVNIPTFGNCSSLLNPVVASATASASGVLTPQPCVPLTTTPWTPGKTDVLMANMPALMDYCICTCTYMGLITITSAGETSISSAMPGPDMSAMMAELKAAADEAQKNAQKEMEESLKEDKDKDKK